MIEISSANQTDCQQIEKIAKPIWEQHYTPIIGSQQVEYMLNKFQSATAVQSQMEQGYEYFIVYYESEPAGYMAVEAREKSLFISKFYLSLNYRGKGVAKVMLNKVIQLAEQKGLKQLELTVNKYNPAYQVYLKLGFINQESIQIDIGNGYIMDDYRMLKYLE